MKKCFSTFENGPTVLKINGKIGSRERPGSKLVSATSQLGRSPQRNGSEDPASADPTISLIFRFGGRSALRAAVAVKLLELEQERRRRCTGNSNWCANLLCEKVSIVSALCVCRWFPSAGRYSG